MKVGYEHPGKPGMSDVSQTQHPRKQARFPATPKSCHGSWMPVPATDRRGLGRQPRNTTGAMPTDLRRRDDIASCRRGRQHRRPGEAGKCRLRRVPPKLAVMFPKDDVCRRTVGSFRSRGVRPAHRHAGCYFSPCSAPASCPRPIRSRAGLHLPPTGCTCRRGER